MACTDDILDQYQQSHDPKHPLVCCDEWLKELIEETRVRRPAGPGPVERYYYEYRRHGLCNLHLCLGPVVGQRHVRISERRTRQDFAQCVKWLVDKLHPKADRIRLILDNLNTHIVVALCETYQPDEARRTRKKTSSSIHPSMPPVDSTWLRLSWVYSAAD